MMASFFRCALLIVPWLCVGTLGCGSVKSAVPGVADPSLSESVQLTAAEVQTIIAQAATEASRRNLPVTIAVVDHTGIVLGVLQMAGAPTTTTPSGGGTGGLEGMVIDDSAAAAAISKAGTGAFFGTQGNAFTTRTASFIVQEHFPPQVDPSPGGPLFGVQFSNLRCSDVDRGSGTHAAAVSNLPLGLSADPGGLPLYKNGVAVGGIGVEGDGIYTLDPGQPDSVATTEEMIAAAGTLGFSAPMSIRGDSILVVGFQFVFANAEPPPRQATTAYDTFAAAGKVISAPIPGETSPFVARKLADTQGTVPQVFATSFKAGTSPAQGGLTIEDVTGIINRAGAQADRTRAAIRLPIGTPARVSVTVVDASGAILGMFRTLDAPIFGFDVSAQKARTAAFFSSATAARDLQLAGFSNYVAAAAADGISLDGKVAFSTRAVGFLSQPIFPPGAIGPFEKGPFSNPLGTWSVFNTGLQLDMYQDAPGASLFTASCTGTALPSLPNGITIFPGGFPLYKAGVLVGAIGISGDGVDQDDLIGFTGSMGFEAPAAMRSDNVVVRGVTLPYARFPRHPNL
jgi:uncharacterized protein GlcG (DUF336 family)